MEESPTATTDHQLVDAVTDRARRRDQAAAVRDRRAQVVADALRADPAAFDAKEVARLAAGDRHAAEDDRQAAADGRGDLIDALLRRSPGPEPVGPGIDLRPRETEVLVRLAAGLTARQIADDLYLSVNTVKTHTRTLYRKLGVRTRVAAANWARQHGY